MAPHEMTKAEFTAAATAERLVNHGRKWNVILGAYSSFSDAETECSAKADVHRAAVSNALYLNTPDGEGLNNGGMPPIRVLVDYLDLVDNFNVVSTIATAEWTELSHLEKRWSFDADQLTQWDEDDECFHFHAYHGLKVPTIDSVRRFIEQL